MRWLPLAILASLCTGCGSSAPPPSPAEVAPATAPAAPVPIAAEPGEVRETPFHAPPAGPAPEGFRLLRSEIEELLRGSRPDGPSQSADEILDRARSGTVPPERPGKRDRRGAR